MPDQKEMSMPDRKVRMGFCGVGAIGQMAHLRNYVLEEGCEVVALAELRLNTGRSVAQRYGVAFPPRRSRRWAASSSRP